MVPTLLVLQHVAHERIGTLGEALIASGCRLMPLNVADASVRWPRLDEVQGVIAMGGPMSVYQQARYSWIAQELAFLRQAVRAGTPILGVCLGAQMLASALGARVMPNPQKEIGWFPIMREPEAEGDSLMSGFGSTETVFQWHGDTWTLPKGAVRLARSPLCQEQAFRYGERVYGVQFHVEVTEAMIRAWMQTPVNKAELASLRGVVDPMLIRRQSPHHLVRLQELSTHVARTFAGLLTQEVVRDARR
jgi:GMP synthase (glutamine-hydrolysing)